MKMLYLCYNNKGRSPALEAFTNHYLSREGVHDVVVDSAGVGVESINSLRRTSSRISRTVRKILSEHGLNMEQKKIKHLGEIGRKWNLVLAADWHTADLVWEHSHRLYDKTILAKEYAGYEDDLEIHGPYHYQEAMDPSEWTERAGYDIMISEIRNVSKRVAQRLARESAGIRGRENGRSSHS